MTADVLSERGARQPRSGWPTWMRSIWHNAFFYRKTWRSSIISSTLQPLLYFFAMGLGLGALVDHARGGVDGVSYLKFVAPGLLAAAALHLGIEECTYPVMMGLKWVKSYWAKVATPLDADDVALGHLGWVAFRLLLSSTIFFVVMVIFGTVTSFWGLLAVPAAVLTGLATGAPTAAYAAVQKDDAGFPLLFRLGVLPLFLFSGIFFPITSMPGWVQAIAQISPLTRGASLIRSLTLDQGIGVSALISLAYLSIWFVVGVWLTIRAFRKMLIV